MKRALILINAYTLRESELNQSRRLCEELARFGVRADIVRNDCPDLWRNGGSGYDFCFYLDKDRAVSHLLEQRGLRLFNRADAIETCDDKMRTYLALAGRVLMPPTLPAPLCYTPSAHVSDAFLDRTAEILGLPLVVKECYGSLGGGVYLARDREELLALAERLKGKACLFQKFAAESAGRDLRVIVTGGRVTAAMTRSNDKDFRSNLELGGRAKPFVPDALTAALCADVANILGLDYCGIDLLFAKDGFSVCEVNSNAFFGGIERVTGVNVARAYAEHAVRTVYGE